MKDWNSNILHVGDKVEYKLKNGSFLHIGKVREINQEQNYLIISQDGMKDTVYLNDCVILNRI